MKIAACPTIFPSFFVVLKNDAKDKEGVSFLEKGAQRGNFYE